MLKQVPCNYIVSQIWTYCTLIIICVGSIEVYRQTRSIATQVMKRMVRWCIWKTRLTLACEVIRYCLVQFWSSHLHAKELTADGCWLDPFGDALILWMIMVFWSTSTISYLLRIPEAAELQRVLWYVNLMISLLISITIFLWGFLFPIQQTLDACYYLWGFLGAFQQTLNSFVTLGVLLLQRSLQTKEEK